MAESFLEVVGERVLVFDGATGTNLQALELTVDDFGGDALAGCNEVLVRRRPDVIRSLHDSFLSVGVDVVETDTFGAFSTVLAEYGLADQAYELNVLGARLAREVVDGYSRPDRPRFVAGSIGPGTKFPSLGQIRLADLRDSYEVQARGLLDGGVDLFVIETVFDLLQAKAAIIACRRAMAATGRSVPIQVQVTLELTGRMLPGTEIQAALCSLAAMKPDVIGLNCATGPAEMGEHLRYLAEHTAMPISCLPNAGMPSVVDGRMHYDLSPDELASYHRRFISELGVSVVGGCCGTTPEHLRRVVDACADLTPAKREIHLEPGVASIYSHVPFHQESAFFAVGERANANGSRAFREAMLAKEWDRAVAIAKDQVRHGAHAIDLCVDYTGADGVADMDELAGRCATQVSLPLVLDSTEADVIEAGLTHIGGRPIINSVNLEDGSEPGTRLDRFLRLASEYGSAVVCTCIDETGQARTGKWKLRAAEAIAKLAVERYGLAYEDLLIDPLVLPISTGMQESRRDGLETLEGIRLIKRAMPGVSTIIGLSNVSFGLNPAARRVLNSVFLAEAIKAGLDAAIVNPAGILPLSQIDPEHLRVCLDLIYDRRSADYDPLADLLRLFEGVESKGDSRREDRTDWPLERLLSQRIVDGDQQGLQEDLERALELGHDPLSIINEMLLEGMKTVGDLFGSGQMQLPFVLASAETMKAAVSYLETKMEKAERSGKGRLVLATVKGDVHDIGKNLVDIILSNNGYEVFNLGIKIPIGEIVAKASEVGADAIGMSGLLVKSTLIMRENLEELNARSLSHIPVILGGAALNRTYVERDLRQVYKGPLFYGKDAFEGLSTMDQIVKAKATGGFPPDFGRQIRQSSVRSRLQDDSVGRSDISDTRRSESVQTDNQIFQPPFIGSRVAKGLALDEIAAYLNETALYRNQWGYRPSANESDDQFKLRVREILREQLQLVKEGNILVPQVVWGYFPANSDGNALIVFKDEDRRVEWLRFSLPRQSVEPRLCIADFFRPVTSGEPDWVGMHIVTMGQRVSQVAADLFARNEYRRYLLLHGLGVEMTEALAEYWHHRIRAEWGFVAEDGPTLTGLFRQKYRGGRYSFGYPACPDLAGNVQIAELLDATRIGVTTTEEMQYEPEQTTSAIICHHPQAKYFVVR